MKTTHNLPFEDAEWEANVLLKVVGNTNWLDDFNEFRRFKVGTCYGLWASTDITFDILAIDNKEPHNGHLNDVFEWFEASCIRENKSLRVLEVWNQGFLLHLLNKRGFIQVPNSFHVIKHMA